MRRILWVAATLAAVSAALVIGVPAGVATPPQCPNDYSVYHITGPGDPEAAYDLNNNGIVCNYVGDGVAKVDPHNPKPPIVDDTTPNKTVVKA